MRFPLTFLLLCSLLFTSCATTSPQPEREKREERGSIFTRWIPKLQMPKLQMPKLHMPKLKMPKFPKIPKLWGGDREKKSRRAKSGGLDMEMTVTPLPLNLSEVRRMEVTIKLINRGKRMVQLQFPTAQRIEVVVLNEKGGKVMQWSEDQYFESAPSFLTINPGERVQYDLKVATRDLVGGRKYTLEASVPGYEPLKERFTLMPLP